jgi:predicted HicB family RNase H-like nuclease
VVRINYELPDTLHREAKSAAAQQGVSLREFVTQAIEAAVDAHAKAKRERR